MEVAGVVFSGFSARPARVPAPADRSRQNFSEPFHERLWHSQPPHFIGGSAGFTEAESLLDALGIYGKPPPQIPTGAFWLP